MELKTYFALDGNARVIPNVRFYVYLAGTNTLAPYLEDENGIELPNPFSSGTTGKVFFSAPNGDYDIRSVKNGVESVERVQFNDVSDSVDAAVAAAAAAEGSAIAAEAARDQTIEFIESRGYRFAGDYAAGIELTEYNQLVRDENGEFWSVSRQVDLPYVTTGTGVPEGDALVPAGDAVLRQDLADPGKGAAMVAYGGGTVADKLNEIVSGAVTEPLVDAKVETHNHDADAHPELSAAISAEADRAELAADSAEAASNNAFVNADVYPDVAAGLSAVADGGQFQVISSNGLELIRYVNDVGVGREVARFPSSDYLREVSRDEAFRYGQPNLFSVEQLSLTSAAAFSGGAAAKFAIETVNSRKTLRVYDGSLIVEWPVSLFSDSGLASASLWVEKLQGATSISRIRLSQADQGGTINYLESYMGAEDFASPRKFFISGLALHPDADVIRLTVQTSSTTGSSVWIRDFCVCAGSDWRFRDVSQEEVAKYAMNEGGALSDGDLEVVPSSNLAAQQYFVEGQYITNAGGVQTAVGWNMYRIPVKPDTDYTFGNFVIDTAGYSSFLAEDNTLIQYNGSHGGSQLPKTFRSPAVPSYLCIDVSRPTNTPDDYARVIVNEGDELLPYEEPVGTVTAIKGHKIAGSVNPSEYARLGFDADFMDVSADSITASALILNLPSGTSVPADVELNQAWIDETDSTIKVRLT